MRRAPHGRGSMSIIEIPKGKGTEQDTKGAVVGTPASAGICGQ